MIYDSLIVCSFLPFVTSINTASRSILPHLVASRVVRAQTADPVGQRQEHAVHLTSSGSSCTWDSICGARLRHV